MLFSKEYLSHGYADRRMGILDSSVWRILTFTFPRGEGRYPSFRVWGRGLTNRLYNVTIKHLEHCVLLNLSSKQGVNIRWSTVCKCDCIIIFFLNLIPWSRFKEMDQGHEMSFLILNREVKRMFFVSIGSIGWRFKSLLTLNPYPNLLSVFNHPPQPPHPHREF